MKDKKLSHSGLGRLSFFISLIVGVGIFADLFWGLYLELTTPGGIDRTSVAAGIIGVTPIWFVSLGIVGLILGVVSLFMENKKMWGILGIILNMIFILFVVLSIGSQLVK